MPDSHSRRLLKKGLDMNTGENVTKPKQRNELAKERTRESADRTLNAWIRTSISLIGFGFAIAKSYEYVETGYEGWTGKILDPFHAPLFFGGAFIVLGLLGTFAAVIQYGRILDRIRSGRFTYMERQRLSQIMAISVLVIGLFGLVAVGATILHHKWF
jgi:putative membrane protein